MTFRWSPRSFRPNSESEFLMEIALSQWTSRARLLLKKQGNMPLFHTRPFTAIDSCKLNAPHPADSSGRFQCKRQ